MTSVRRRQMLFAAAALLSSRFTPAQERLRRVAGLFGGSPRSHAKALEAFRSGLNDHGWVEGRNLSLELHWVDGKMDRVPALAAEIVRSKPDLIVTAALSIIAEIKKATQTIPIVMATGGDPREWGLVASLARPGGNLTGVSGFYESTPVKMLELAGALVPPGARVVAFLEAKTSFSVPHHREAFAKTTRTLGLETRVVEVSSPDDVSRALEALAKDKPAVLVVLPGPMLFALGESLVKRAEALAIPVIYGFEELVEAGGLMSYAPNNLDSYRRAARYVDRILKGANPGDLPIEQPTRLSLAINLRTANAQRIRIPQPILQRADRVIE